MWELRYGSKNQMTQMVVSMGVTQFQAEDLDQALTKADEKIQTWKSYSDSGLSETKWLPSDHLRDVVYKAQNSMKPLPTNFVIDDPTVLTKIVAGRGFIESSGDYSVYAYYMQLKQL